MIKHRRASCILCRAYAVYIGLGAAGWALPWGKVGYLLPCRRLEWTMCISGGGPREISFVVFNEGVEIWCGEVERDGGFHLLGG